jgi:paraquat-inducible protein A
MRHRDPDRNRWAAALALSSLLFYPAAIGLPLLNISKLGHSSTDSLLSGLVSMFSQGYWLVGGVVLLFSILLPPLKLLALWLLTSQLAQQPHGLIGHRRRALLYHAVEVLGRWGMLDVMLVAVLVAMVKLGDLVQIEPGPGLWAFTLMVLLSLIASMVFNPTQMWSERQSND